MTLVLFDFDGTITKRDTLFSFMRSFTGISFYFRFITLVPGLLLYVLGWRSAEAAKSAVLSAFLLGKSRREIEEAGVTFCRRDLPGILRKDIFESLKRYIEEGATVCVVSASCDAWVVPFCDGMKIDHICTEFEYDVNGYFTGRFSTPNCKGEEKKRRIMLKYDLARYSRVVAYGNSSDDQQMFSVAHERNLV